jgi:hypothetical protein
MRNRLNRDSSGPDQLSIRHPAPYVISAEIVEDLQTVTDEFALIAEDLRKP